MEEYLKRVYKINIGPDFPCRIDGFTRKRGLPRLFRKLGYRVGAEIGVEYGAQSIRFCREFCKETTGLKLLCIDSWEPYDFDRSKEMSHYKMDPKKNYAMAQEMLRPYNVTFIKGYSMDVVKTIPEESLDFVYIDANHYYDFIKEDLREWSKRVRKGGVVSGHDYYVSSNCDVIQAVDEYVKEQGIERWFLTDDTSSSYFWVKK
jgi:hypothetical protein